MRNALDLCRLHVVDYLAMNNRNDNYSHAANQNAAAAIKQARYMQWDAEANGYGLMPLVGFYRLARAMAVAADQMDADARKEARSQRQRRADVQGYISDMRAVGAWDGE